MERLPQRAAQLLRAKAHTIATKRLTIGLDGFVDEIVSVVDKRASAEKFTRVPTLTAFGARVSAAAGRSANAELVVERVKLGGNGPIMANALAALGAQVTYIGNLGIRTSTPFFPNSPNAPWCTALPSPGAPMRWNSMMARL